MAKFVQVCGCFDMNGNVVPFISNEEAEFYGVYVGEEGEYRWQADFLRYDVAMAYATAISKARGLPIDDKTYTEGASNGTTH